MGLGCKCIEFLPLNYLCRFIKKAGVQQLT